jgi:superfamily II DNA or RNA helicase
MALKIKGVLTHHGFCIKKKQLKDTIHEIKNYFTLIPELNMEEAPKKIKAYYEDANYLILPKFFSNETIKIKEVIFNSEKINKIEFYTTNSFYHHENIEIEFKGTLRPHQTDIVNAVMKKFNNENEITYGYLLSIYTGGGKTISGTKICSNLKLKTLVICHTEFLMKQFYDSFVDFTIFKSIGYIHQNKFEIECDIVIASLQTIISRNYGQDDFKIFGLVIYDECHHLGSNTFSNILKKTAGIKYSVCLSATIDRVDKMDILLKWYAYGTNVFELRREYVYRVFIKRINFNDTITKTFKEYNKMFKGRLTPDIIKIKTHLLENEIRNNMIVELIQSLKFKGRRIFVFSDRIKQLEYLKIKIDELNTLENNTDKYITGLFVADTHKTEKQNIKLHACIIFINYQIGTEGLSIDAMDTLITCSPLKLYKTIIQCYGRIQRKQGPITDILKLPLIIEISDEIPVFKKWELIRDDIYKDENYYVENHYIKNKELIFYDKLKHEGKKWTDIVLENIMDENFLIEKLFVKDDEKITKPKNKPAKYYEDVENDYF